MAVKLVSVKCPECGAMLDIEEGRDQAFCTYCGAKVVLFNENEHIYRHVDEAEVKQAETDRIVKLKQLEFLEEKIAAAKQKNALKVKIIIVLEAIGIPITVIGLLLSSIQGAEAGSFLDTLIMIGLIPVFVGIYLAYTIKKQEDEDNTGLYVGDKVKVPSAIEDYEEKSYSAIEAMLVSAGFTNVKCIGLNDLTVGLLTKPGMVESIVINGDMVTEGGKKYPKDASVIISYHSLNR